MYNMDPSAYNRYISPILNYYRNFPEIDSVFLDILEQFALEKSLSAYQVCFKLKSTDLKMAYKNVNKRIHGLISLNLIQETETEANNVNKHNAKYYRLTEYGIYQLFLNKLNELRIREFNTVKFTKSPSSNTLIFFHNYADNLLFESFVYPYFEKETLFAIGDYLLWDLYKFLADCCYRIKNQIELYDYNIPIADTLFYWNKVRGTHKKKLLLHLKDQFNLESIDSCDVGESKHDGNIATITVKTSAATILLRYDEDRKNVTLMSTDNSDGRYKQLEYDADKVGSDIWVVKQRPDEELMGGIVCDTRDQLQQIIYGFISGLSIPESDSKGSQENSYYCKILSQDKKFMATAEDIYKNRHKGFEKGYRMLNNISE
jgi:hypothetical protein